MVQHPFLKSIKPVNLLSFGPDTEEIALGTLNILIGPNGSGKSNLIEIMGLLQRLPSKSPWSEVIDTGGVDEWIWKGSPRQISEKGKQATIEIAYSANRSGEARRYEIVFEKNAATFSIRVVSESLWTGMPETQSRFIYLNRPPNAADSVYAYLGSSPMSKFDGLDSRLSALSLNFAGIGQEPTGGLSEGLAKVDIYPDWKFGRHGSARDPQRVGLDSYRLASDSTNLAQVLKALRDRGDSDLFDRLLDLMQKFYEPVKDVDAELVGTHLRIMIKEEGLSSRTPAERLSDGTLRWLMLLLILLNPNPAPVTCIEEPDLGLHPDMLPTLADLLVEASQRTQLVVTTHSDTLLDAFTETPEVVLVCEKVEGATTMKRLDRERLAAWRDKYSLGKLWMSGEIGGNRW